MTTIHVDIVIFGGGIAGLWLLNRFQSLGYRVILLESDAIGAGQTVCSQGIIHGGMKYSLKGQLTDATKSIAMMPARWQACLKSQGEIDLSGVNVLSENHYFWSPKKLTAKLLGFFAKQMLNANLQQLKTSDQPSIFQQENFKGVVYRLNEQVLDVNSLLASLMNKTQQSIYKIDAKDYQFFLTESGSIDTISFTPKNEENFSVQPKQVIFSAGAGNENLLTQLGVSKPPMQCRPLHMVLVKHKYPLPLYAHCLGYGSKPRVTITTHQHEDGDWIWYIGGDLAESGVDFDKESQIIRAQQEIKQVLPWVDLSNAVWTSFLIDRAEQHQENGQRPDNVFVAHEKNYSVVWPTKLALTPQLSEIIEQLAITPSGLADEIKLALPRPLIAKPIWDQLF